MTEKRKQQVASLLFAVAIAGLAWTVSKWWFGIVLIIIAANIIWRVPPEGS